MSVAAVLSGEARWAIDLGDVRDLVRKLPENSIDCVVTSPPYWGLRDYGTDGQIGLEATPDEWCAVLVEVFREVRRALTPAGTLWLNVGDAYAGSWGAQSREGYTDESSTLSGATVLYGRTIEAGVKQTRTGSLKRTPGLKQKDLIGLPWLLAFALRSDGWYLRCDIVWSKPNPMPESVTDRPTKAHEYLFLLTKSARYEYDADAIREKAIYPDGPNSPQSIASPYGQGFTRRADKQRGHSRRHAGFNDRWDAMSKAEQQVNGRNKRSVWTIATEPTSEAHFATFPTKLVEPCVLAGSQAGGVVLDPFAGSGTTLLVALRHGRRAIGVELNAAYRDIAVRRIESDARANTLHMEAAS